jgi:hypothetical protein
MKIKRRTVMSSAPVFFIRFPKFDSRFVKSPLAFARFRSMRLIRLGRNTVSIQSISGISEKHASKFRTIQLWRLKIRDFSKSANN